MRLFAGYSGLHENYKFRNMRARMQSLTEKVFHLAPPGGVFCGTVIRNLFPDVSDGARLLLVHRAVTANEIIRLKPGLFVLAPPYRKNEPHPFAIAGMLYGVSHVSIESALAFHGLIPEAVFQVGSVSIDRAKTFSTPIGVFSYHRVPLREPRAGVEAIKLPDGFWAFVATPLRAIADLVYLRKDVTWEGDGLDFITESLRVEESDLLKIKPAMLNKLIAQFTDKRVIDYLTGLKEVLHHADRCA